MTAQMNLDAGHQFKPVDRLADIIVGPDGKQSVAGILIDHRRKDDDRQVAMAGIRPQGLQKGLAVHDRHHEVQQDEVRCERLDLVQSFAAIHRAFHLSEPHAFKHGAREYPVHLVVLDDENPGLPKIDGLLFLPVHKSLPGGRISPLGKITSSEDTYECRFFHSVLPASGRTGSNLKTPLSHGKGAFSGYCPESCSAW
jgi:hypothetical protein